MNRPVSPNTVSEIPRSISDMITVESFNLSAEHGFNYIKNKLNKTVITPGEILLEFYNYNSLDDILCTNLFCVSCLVLLNMKNELNEIDSEVYNKMLTYTVNKYNERIG